MQYLFEMLLLIGKPDKISKEKSVSGESYISGKKASISREGKAVESSNLVKSFFKTFESRVKNFRFDKKK